MNLLLTRPQPLQVSESPKIRPKSSSTRVKSTEPCFSNRVKKYRTTVEPLSWMKDILRTTCATPRHHLGLYYSERHFLSDSSPYSCGTKSQKSVETKGYHRRGPRRDLTFIFPIFWGQEVWCLWSNQKVV